MQVHFHPCISFSFVFMVQSFERRKMQKAVSTFSSTDRANSRVIWWLSTDARISFMLFIIRSLRHDIRSVGQVQHKINSCIGVRCLSSLERYYRWALRFSTSCPHVPLCSFAQSFYLIAPLNFGHNAFRICLDFVFSRQKQKFEEHKSNLRDQQITFRIATEHWLNSNNSNVLACSLIQSQISNILIQ